MKDRTHQISVATAVLLLLATVAACTNDEDPGNGMMGAAPANVTGEWSVTQVEVSDPCNLFGGVLITPWIVENLGADVSIAIETMGACRTNTYSRSGNVVVRQSAGLFLDPQGTGCQANLTQTETFTFTSTEISGTITSRFEYAAGACNRPYPCDVSIDVSGLRCANCSICN